MTLHRSINKYMLGGNQITWEIIKTLLAAGWTIPMSGSGIGGLWTTGNVFDMAQTVYVGTSVPANGIGIGSEPWGKGDCWVVLEDPGGNRQHIFRRAGNQNTDSSWHWGYSLGGRFGEGQTPGTDWDEDTEPIAPDVAHLVGTPTSEASFLPAAGTYTLSFVLADDVPSAAGEYGFVQMTLTAVNESWGAIMVDPLDNVPPGHPHPLTMGYWWGRGGEVFTDHYMSQSWSKLHTWCRLGEALEAFASINYVYPRWGSVEYVQQRRPSTDGKERALVAPVGFENNEGYMGLSHWIKWAPFNHGGYPRTANSFNDLFVDDAIFVDLLNGTPPVPI